MGPTISRRRLLAGVAGAAGLASTAAWNGRTFAPQPGQVGPDLVSGVDAGGDQAELTTTLRPRRVTIDLGGPQVRTWGYAEDLPGPLIRARAGDLVRVDLVNELPVDTSVHWHGIALRNDMDGVPGLTQPPIGVDCRYTYEFTVPDPGTYFYHPHSGLQLDRGLYGVLVVEDPHETGRYDHEWIVVLDDWIDGTGRTPEEVLAALRETGGHGDMPGMDHGATHGEGDGGTPGPDHGGPAGTGGHGGMDAAGPGGHGDMGGMEMMTSPLLGGAGDVSYPHHLVNGRIPAAPRTFRARPGQRARIRVINAGADTAYRLALGGHRLTVTHTDGFPVQPFDTDALLLGMGERVDVEVELGDGVFPLVAAAEGKIGQGLALVRTGAGRTPLATVRPAELDRRVLDTASLRAADRVALTDRRPDRVHQMQLDGSMAPYRWTINGATFDEAEPLPIEHGERVRLEFVNRSDMFHPMHLHGHTFAVAGGGARKDTVIVVPDRTVAVEFDADNPGRWMAHCHNAYHAESGMMATLTYRA
ncbi:multicopper oxidase family protein [Micromonospora thermarum]|uniref:Multicopper oxidase family protein n=1 Tax=Micromonospora thermarum TaxID=2720024 RepID=A0ABX0ZCZ6_9ACTN|nr:multicopper oxidase family protein [Micromonospora thermarum]NJP35800.1 multicopper oxidase family protein [Micromonospora thermarum]